MAVVMVVNKQNYDIACVLSINKKTLTMKILKYCKGFLRKVKDYEV